ncbi:MAG: DUF4349 domain-containing protein [Spirochaetaceae bacterium]|jgi:hypothetical protein|nr:DUF4349 domain-containing protein [Spirochaetaceae bacterium]
MTNLIGPAKIRVLFFLLCICLGACAKGNSGAEPSVYDTSEMETSAAAEVFGSNFAGRVGPGTETAENSRTPEQSGPVPGGEGRSRRLVKRAAVIIEADPSLLDGDGRLAAGGKIKELLNRHGAYSEHARSDENSAFYTIRVPQGSYDALLSGIGVLGRIQSRTETAEDVTVKYYDLAGRLNTKKALLVTFQNYLEQTKSIDDIMTVETRIADLQNEIDGLGSEFTELAGLVDYSTIELNLHSPDYLSEYTLKDRVGELFGSFGKFLSGLILAVLGAVIFGLPIVVLLLAAFWLLLGRVGLLRKAFRLALEGRRGVNHTETKGRDKNSGNKPGINQG